MWRSTVLAAIKRSRFQGRLRNDRTIDGDTGDRTQFLRRHDIRILEIDADHPHVWLRQRTRIERAEQRLERLADLHVGTGMGNTDQLDRLDLP